VLTFQTPSTQAVIASLSSLKMKEWGLQEIKKLINLYIHNVHEKNAAEFLDKPSLIHHEKSNTLNLQVSKSAKRMLRYMEQKSHSQVVYKINSS
jgi:hypothetical protein